jgi:hypothetical protein
MDTPINILINGESLIEYFDQVSIKFSEGSFCNSIDIGIKSKELWDKFDPIQNFGVLKLQVPIGNMNYEFLIEERNTTVNVPGISFTAWGRSAQALFDKPYSKTVNDEEEKIHPWQTGDCTVLQIISYAIGYCCSAYIQSKVSVHWNVENFTVYENTFSASHSSPIDIISTLAGIIGAEFIANADGSITVQEYSVQEGTIVQEYNDLDHIVSLSDDIVYPIGYNSVMVYGYGTSANSTASLTAELIKDALSGWEYGKYRRVRCYYYHSKGLSVAASAIHGVVRSGGSGTESFTEWVLLTWGSGSTTHINLEGETTIKGNENTPLEFVEVTYQCRYHDFMVASFLDKTDNFVLGVLNVPQGIVAFYFTDHTNTTTISFDYIDLVNDEVIQLDWDDDTTSPDASSSKYDYYWNTKIVTNPETIRRNATMSLPYGNSGTTSTSPAKLLLPADGVKFRIWGPFWNHVEKCFDSVYNICTPIGIKLEGNTRTFDVVDEELCFSNGSANLSRPYYSDGSVVWETPETRKLLFTSGTTVVKIAGYNSLDFSKPFSIGRVCYKSNYIVGNASVPKGYAATNYYVYLQKKQRVGSDGKLIDPEFLSISKTVSNPIVGTKDIAILVKDFATDVVIPNAHIVIDGNWGGMTDENGLLTLKSVTVGDHKIVITATGYLNSDEDELANDTFTITNETTTTSGILQ